MNFISQSLEQLTSGGKIYIVFQCIYILLGVYALYILTKLSILTSKVLKILKDAEVKEELHSLLRKQMKEWVLNKETNDLVKQFKENTKDEHHV